jgi:mono/diheme cytochrome c family protein
MVGYRLNLFLFVLVVASVGLALSIGRDVTQPNFESRVEGQMGHSPAYASFSENPNFPDRMTLRTPPVGTIARGQMPLPFKATPEDAIRAGLVLKNPFSQTDEQRLKRGSVVFANFCQVCHGPLGQGDGPVTQGGFPLPSTLLADRALQMPDGQMFHVLTYGQGRMPSVAPQLSRDDRWCAVLHVRQLQRLQVPSGKHIAVSLPEVAQLYRQNCSACHAEDGSGKFMRKSLPNIPDFTSLAWQVGQTEMALVNQIEYGSLPLMPAFRYRLTREQILGLAVYVRSFPSRPAGAPGPLIAHLSPVEIYQTFCWCCHDTTGRGDASMRKLAPELPDFTSPAWQKSRTGQHLAQSILLGKGKFMLAMSDKLGSANIQQMVALVREFSGGKKEIPFALPKVPGPVATEENVQPPPDDTKEIPLPKKDEEPVPAPSRELDKRIRMGSDVFRQFCINCHGPDGTGAVSRESLPPIPDFTDPKWHKTKEDVELVASILQGKGTLMPANSDKITRDQARDLVAYVRAFGPTPPPPPPGLEDAFQKQIRRLQLQWDEYERQLKKLKSQPGQ